MRLSVFITGFILLGGNFLFAQYQSSSAQILHQLQKLQNTTRVLYLAAHPDDENTRMISWLENDRHMRTAYLSLTRGDGGQNLIGTELGAKLGVLRTQELMQARAIDGGEQFFTRAVDFGYSKTADETFRQWSREEVLADVVWVIRHYQPDIIITRFPPDERAGHGHHTASAILGMEAFDLAADPKAFPEQLEYVQPWQVKRLFWNHSTWWRQNLDSIAAADDGYSVVDIGAYNALLGMSCNELGSYSRSQHKSQGFGVSVARGSTKEYLQLLKGEKVANDIVDGITQGWQRYSWPDGDRMLNELVENFDPLQPGQSAEAMMDLMKGSNSIGNPQVRNWFQTELSELIAAALGLHVELVSSREYVPAGSEQNFRLEMINRSKAEVRFTALIPLPEETSAASEPEILPFNELRSVEVKLNMPQDLSQPYWLVNNYDEMFQVDDQLLIGKPENSAVPEVVVEFQVNGRALMLKPLVNYKFTDRVDGEIARPVVSAPPVVVNFAEANLVFVNEQPQQLEVEIRLLDEADHTLVFEAEGWQITPRRIEVKPTEGSGSQMFSIMVAPASQGSASEYLSVQIDSEPTSAMSLTEIDYDHIDKRVVFEAAAVKLVRMDLSRKGEKVGYIEGAGDMVPEALRQMGYEVVMLTKDMVLSEDLSAFQAIVAGIRAYNTQDWLSEAEDELFRYMDSGGNFIVQYNTASRDLQNRQFGPYPFTLSRERVTEEDAAVEFILKDHPVLNVPNKLGQADFDDWVQERGLYFASDWDKAYQAPLGWHDEGEPTRAGGLLVANKGKGAYIYTGISFFRELPAGVPGAYRLLANLISYEPITHD